MKLDWKNAPVSLLDEFDAGEVLNLLPDGAYITDTERRIVFWNCAAQRITGWSAKDVVGRRCHDNILVHVDKDGHALCGREHCPLHRSMVTGQMSSEPLVIFARHKSGSRMPVEVTVAPLRDRAGKIIGGIEIFRDLTETMRDQLRARNILQAAINCMVPADERVRFVTRYQPHSLVGGDFFQIEKLDSARYAVLVADAVGHGVSAALYTLLLRSLWEEHRSDVESPARFMGIVNDRLQPLRGEDGGYFGTAVLGCYNAESGQLQLIDAGHPSPLLFRATGSSEPIGYRNPALGLTANTRYRETAVQLERGDALLFYTDGATEVFNSRDQELGMQGLEQLVRAQVGSGAIAEFDLDHLEEQLLRFSGEIRLTDDLTLVKLSRLA